MTTETKTNGKSEPRPFRVDIRQDGVAVVTIDVPGEPVNTLNARFSEDFARAMETLETATNVKAVVIISGKPDSFLAGADVNMLKAVKTADEAAALSKNGQQAMQRLADLPMPVVAAIHGPCLGGGLELALACDARVCTDDKKTKLGLPEVQLGLLPGAGGTQRLPRLIGLQAALDLILTGKQVPGRKAQKLGLVDEVAPNALLSQVAAELALTLAAKPVADKNPMDRMTSAFRHLLSEDIQDLVLEDNPLGRKVLFDQAKKKLLEKTHGNYPAPEKALEAVRAGYQHGMARGFEVEAENFGELVVSPEAAELMNIFFSTQALKKDRGTDDPEAAAKPVSRVGMLGGGLMGGGIAYVTAQVAGIPVRLKDKDDAGVGRGLHYVRGILDERVSRKRMTAIEREQTMARLTGTTEMTGFGDIDVVIEAVFEDLGLKQRVLGEVEAACKEDVIFASNTSTIPITQIAEAARHPENVIGMHYFSPVHKMPLLEIIVTDKTAPSVTATCVKLGKRQGKTVIVVRDGVGFYTSRILGPYINEALHLVAEGVPVEQIDRALVAFGFPVGPIKLLDEVGIDVANKAAGVVGSAFGDRLEAPAGMEKLIGDGRFGRKSKKGFYRYDGKKGVDESVYALLGVTPKREPKLDKDIQLRCVLQMVNEAAYCFGEGILRSARDGDIGAVFGLGFPPFRGGPFRFVDRQGVKHIVEHCERFQKQCGKRFSPAPVLSEMAASGSRFHGGENARAIPGKHGEPIVGTRARA